MPDLASITQLLQILPETTAGTTPGAGAKRLRSLSFGPFAPKNTVKTFTPRGDKYLTVAAQNKEWVEGPISGTPTYDEIVYPLSGILQAVTPTQIMDGATPTGAYTWTFAPAGSAADTVKTFSLEEGDATRAHRAAYALVNEFGLSLTREELSAKGSFLAQRISDGITLTAGATTFADVPILASQFDVSLDATFANLGTTKLDRNFAFDWSLGDRFSLIWPVDSTKPSFAGHVEKQPKAEASFIVEADATGMGPLTNLRNGSTVYVRLLATGPNIYTGGVSANYKLQVDLALKIVDTDPFKDNDGVWAIGWKAQMTDDTSLGGPMKVTVVNKLQAL